MAGGVSSPVIISVTIGAVLVLSVGLIAVIRWARTKPSTQLPPPRPAFLSPYHQQRQSAYLGRGVPDVYDEERKLTAHGSGIFKPFGEYAASNASDSSLYRGNKAPYTDGDRTPNSGASFGHETNAAGGTMQQSYNESPQLQPNELGEIPLNSPNPPRQRPASVQFVNGTSTIRPVSSFGSLGMNGSPPLATAGGQAAATVPQSSSSSSSHLPPGAAPPSSFSHHQPPPPRPFSNSARSRHSIAGPPVQQPPPSFNQAKQDRRASRMSMLSTYSSHTFSYDHRRSSVGSMIRGPPHKSNMQIILPQPLAPTAAGNGNLPLGSNTSMYSDAAEDAAIRRNQRRHSRVDMWTETNNFARAKSPMADLADGSRGRNPRPSLGSEKSGRSLELPTGGQRMQPPPPLPAASSRSLLTSSPSATPNSSSSALPPMSSAMTTPLRSMPGSSELVLEKRPGSSDAQSTSTLSNNVAATVDDSKPPVLPQPQPQNDVKPDNLPIIPSIDTK
ncbi:hypothetical protein M407DRAFT_145997 [Tulasnella calospora MUT 4182]|uniref:Uncharacterized protein n=1 Tax=Tulasnella calospora MUT 4182 TaxID=1051891 RepID=A0A0C3QGN3_9AGAM|nr:hypothetical protein M407DRAFT_145997 [Tulasnella calospora MUT 4182]